jgi:hypothetical protein
LYATMWRPHQAVQAEQSAAIQWPTSRLTFCETSQGRTWCPNLPSTGCHHTVEEHDARQMYWWPHGWQELHLEWIHNYFNFVLCG